MAAFAAASAGMNWLSAAMQYNADKKEYKAKKAWQNYSNTMVQLSAGVQQDAITTNQIFAMDALTQQGFQAQQDTLDTAGKTEVASAAAGVKGKSVNLSMRDVLRKAGMREAERQDSFQKTMLDFRNQRTNVAMAAAMQKDYSYIPKPNAASYFLQAAQKNLSMAQGAK
jgi:hypothetical protein